MLRAVVRSAACLLTVLTLAVALALALAVVSAEAAVKRAIRYDDIPSQLRTLLSTQKITEKNFDEHVSSLNQSTAERETIGEGDHLIYFILQSERFTKHPKVEPALSAYEFVRGLNLEEKQQYLSSDQSFTPRINRLPQTAALRFADFVTAIERSVTDERLVYFKSFLQKSRSSSEPLPQRLYGMYARSMKFLYEKEFASRSITDPAKLIAHINSLYQTRGHSTDTQIEANYAIYISLAALKAASPPAQINNVLIIGPGLDFAPRTDLIDIINPQSYQPFAVADALLGLKLSDENRLRIQCVDINNRVVAHLRSLPEMGGPVRLALLSGIADNERRPLSPNYKRYFQSLGESIGRGTPLSGLPARFDRHLKKSLLIRQQVVKTISAEPLNIVTEQYDPAPQYDLVVITNVFPYFNPTELLLSLSNIEAMMKAGGYLIHNEGRQLLFNFASVQNLPVISSRTELIAPNEKAPLYDSVWVHQKKVASGKH